MRLVDELDSDPVDAGSLEELWSHQPGTPRLRGGSGCGGSSREPARGAPTDLARRTTRLAGTPRGRASRGGTPREPGGDLELVRLRQRSPFATTAYRRRVARNGSLGTDASLRPDDQPYPEIELVDIEQIVVTLAPKTAREVTRKPLH